MQGLSEELEAAGVVVDFMAINKDDAVEYQESLAFQADFPMIQDDEKLTIWAKLDGGKDDFFLYHSDGTLALHLPISGTLTTALMDVTGYANMRAAATALK
ncbi:MAG TPA: hypothetical protein DCQ06_03650 [Myxococcales bacterium]|nr:hypothetical protein [Myxococcales bacterium]HAN30670.1 hypothetical protein [Myxococcales bacterium]